VAIVGCSAGMVDFLKIKGTHNAIKSGVLLAEEISKTNLNDGLDLIGYQ
jgi:flavin-dependent dehydrogenase